MHPALTGIELGGVGHLVGFLLQPEKIAFNLVDQARQRWDRVPKALVQAGTFALISKAFAHATSPKRTAAFSVQFAHPHHTVPCSLSIYRVRAGRLLHP